MYNIIPTIPDVYIDSPGDMDTWYRDRQWLSDHWGSPTIDGPDRLNPDNCKWADGRLHCRCSATKPL